MQYLSDEEEDELVLFVVGYSEIGYGYTRRDIMDMVQDVVVRKGLNGTVGGTDSESGILRCFTKAGTNVTY